jgi:hypothetical protein
MSNKRKPQPSSRPPAPRRTGPTQEDWDRLFGEFEAKWPRCPKCGGEWDLDNSSDSESYGDAGVRFIETVVTCLECDEGEMHEVAF